MIPSAKYVPEIDLSKIPRRKRRFFRNKKLLLNALSKHVKRVQDVKEIEKQKIIQELKYRLERTEKAELLGLVDKLFEELSSDQTENIIASNIKAKKRHSEALTKKDYEEIADNIYMQLRETRDVKHIKPKEKKGREKEVEKIKERLATLQGLQKRPRSKLNKTAPTKETNAILGELSKERDKDEILSTIAEEPELETADEGKTLFKELEELSKEKRKK